MYGQAIFTDLKKSHFPLSVELGNSARPLLEELKDAKTLEAFDEFEGDNLAAAIQEIRRYAPSLGRVRKGSSTDGGYRQTSEPGRRVSVRKQHIALEIIGDIGLLDFWPDWKTEKLQPMNVGADGRVLDPSGTWGGTASGEYNFGWPEWVIDYVHHEGDDKNVYTHVLLSDDDEAAVAAGELDLNGAIIERRGRLQPFIDAIARQCAHYYDEWLPELVADHVKRLRRVVANRLAVDTHLTFPGDWKIKPLRLAQINDERPSRVKPTTSDEPTKIGLERRLKLDAATFNDLQRTIRVWAETVTRYPKTFANLGEDRLSDLLTATLNATLPDAQREVFTRSGKSDIFVKSDVLSPGSGTEAVFICEAKWANSTAVVTSALDPQLFSYMTSADTSAVLLLFMPQKSSKPTEAKLLGALRLIDGFESEGKSDVEGWPLLTYRREDRAIDICVAFVNLPRTKANTSPALDDDGFVIES